jgi:uncharacterized protein
MEFDLVTVVKPKESNVILGQSHFIKTVEDLHEALVGAVPGIRFGLAFCEASGACLIRSSGTDEALVQAAVQNAQALAAGHVFVIVLGEGFYPINVLKAVQAAPEVCRIYCATANPLQVVIAETDQGRGVMGVIDGAPPQGVEGPEDVRWRHDLLRTIGYKL